MKHGNEDLFFVANGGAIYGIAFDKIFEQEKLDVYNDFEMSSKRNFKNLTMPILDSYNEIFLDEGGRLNEDMTLVLYNILRAKSILLANENTTFNEFISLIDKITDDGDNLLLTTIDNFVEANYALELDKITEETRRKKKKINVELQFSDDHAKKLLKIAYLYRIVIPIVSSYFCYNKSAFSTVVKERDIDSDEDIEELKFDDTNSKIFAHLFEKFAPGKDGDALRNKLYRLTESRIKKTSYSDNRFWGAAKNVAITKESETLEIYKKVLTNAIPKFSIEKDMNIISFLQSVINNQIDFLFQNKFKHKATPLDANTERYGEEDDDDVSEFERMEIQMSRKDEGSFILRKMNINDICEKIPEKLNVGVSDIEVKSLISRLNRNSVQEQIVSIITFKYFDDRNALKFVDFYQYATLVLACKKYLEEHKFIYLPQILLANCEKHKERLSICGKKVRPEILSSKKYKELFDAKYRNFSEEIEKPFTGFIATTYSSVFTDENGEELFDSSVKVGKIAEEILDLARLV